MLWVTYTKRGNPYKIASFFILKFFTFIKRLSASFYNRTFFWRLQLLQRQKENKGWHQLDKGLPELCMDLPVALKILKGAAQMIILIKGLCV